MSRQPRDPDTDICGIVLFGCIAVCAGLTSWDGFVTDHPVQGVVAALVAAVFTAWTCFVAMSFDPRPMAARRSRPIIFGRSADDRED